MSNLQQMRFEIGQTRLLCLGSSARLCIFPRQFDGANGIGPLRVFSNFKSFLKCMCNSSVNKYYKHSSSYWARLDINAFSRIIQRAWGPHKRTIGRQGDANKIKRLDDFKSVTFTARNRHCTHELHLTSVKDLTCSVRNEHNFTLSTNIACYATNRTHIFTYLLISPIRVELICECNHNAGWSKTQNQITAWSASPTTRSVQCGMFSLNNDDWLLLGFSFSLTAAAAALLARPVGLSLPFPRTGVVERSTEKDDLIRKKFKYNTRPENLNKC